MSRLEISTKLNAGNLQEYDYECEWMECEWKIIYKVNHLVTSYEY